jgi:steroid 5-alpha reductase family enzyme
MTALAFATMFVTPIVLAVSEINRNYSQVDRLWSLLPAIYNVHYAVWAHLNGLPTMKLDHVMAVSIIWGARLTFNYWRKGGYQVGSEDYRWNIVKDYVGGPGMFIFNVTFISLGQNVSTLVPRTLSANILTVIDSALAHHHAYVHPPSRQSYQRQRHHILRFLVWPFHGRYRCS